MSNDVFQQYGAHYDLLYREKDYSGEAEYVAKMLRHADPTITNLLEFGSGTGRHGRLLSEQGLRVFGVERSAAMVAVARKSSAEIPPRNGRFDCIQGDIRSTEVGRQFDAVVSLFHVISYQVSNDDVISTFANAQRHLRPGGVFLFDVWHGPAVLIERPAVRVKRVEDERTRLTRIAEPELDTNRSVVTVRYTMLAESKAEAKLTTFGEEHHVRYFFPQEIDLLARQAGLVVERSEEFLTGAAPSEKTWGVAYLLRNQA